MKLEVPHFKQQHPHTCLPACVQMVLAYWGKTHNEEELAQAFATVPVWGTRPENVVAGLEKLGYHALWFQGATFERLLELLDHGWPIIVFVRAVDLPHGRIGLHAIVAIGIEEGRLIYLDPAVDGEQHMELGAFFEAWSGLGHQGLAVWT